MFTRDDFTHLSTYFLATQAQKLGLTVEKINPESKASYLEITIGKERYFLTGQRSPFLTYSALLACKNKAFTKHFLDNKGFATPRGATITAGEKDAAISFLNNTQKSVVIKPIDGFHGKDVFANISTEKEISDALNTFDDKEKKLVIEEFAHGEEYRILATSKKLLGIIKRVPANVVGNGKDTIEKLIESKNADQRRGTYQNALITIKIDDDLIANLENAGHSLSCVPKKDTTIQLRKTSNLSQGGDSIDYTEKASESIKELAPRLVRAIPGLPYAGIDLITNDITAQISSENPYAIIEMNASPMISMHHEPFEGTQRNVAKVIIEEMIEDAKNQ